MCPAITLYARKATLRIHMVGENSMIFCALTGLWRSNSMMISLRTSSLGMTRKDNDAFLKCQTEFRQSKFKGRTTHGGQPIDVSTWTRFPQQSTCAFVTSGAWLIDLILVMGSRSSWSLSGSSKLRWKTFMIHGQVEERNYVCGILEGNPPFYLVTVGTFHGIWKPHTTKMNLLVCWN